MRSGLDVARTVLWAWAAVLLTTLVDLQIRPDLLVLTDLLALPPLIVSSTRGPCSTAGVALAAVVSAAASGWWNGFDAQYLVRVGNVLVLGALAVALSAHRLRREADLRTSRHIASVAQRALLPVISARIGPVRITSRHHSATDGAEVGGDFFDFVADDGRVRLVLGDVAGHGIDAADAAAQVIRAFRQHAAGEPDLRSAALRIDEHLRGLWIPEQFATAVFVEISRSPGLTIVSAGHPAPLLITEDGTVELTVRPCLPLGLGPATAATWHDWRPGDRLLLYTDGLVEARDSAGVTVAPALIHSALDRSSSAAHCLDELLAGVRAHAGRLGDDVAVLLVENADSHPLMGDARGG